jgi:RHS repeat-associated protein
MYVPRRFRTLLHALALAIVIVMGPGGLPPYRAEPERAEAQGSGNISYAYDALGRLVAVTDENVSTNGTALYKYDAVGNLTGITRQNNSVVALFEFSPYQGPVGSTVILKGRGFSTTPGSNSVTFPGSPLPVSGTVTTATSTQLEVTVPSGALTGPISVQVGAATAISTSSFTVGATPASAAAPTITCVWANNLTCDATKNKGTQAIYSGGSWTPGTQVTISGTNFDTTSSAPVTGSNPTLYPNNTVIFNPNMHAVVLSASSTQLTVEVPAGATSGPVTVSTPGGTAVSPASFYTPPTQVQPGSGVIPPTEAQIAYTQTLTLGTAASFSISSNPNTRVALLDFEGIAGQQLSYAASVDGLSGYTHIDLYKPDGSIFMDNQPRLGAVPLNVLPVTGRYTLMVYATNSDMGSMELTLYATPPSAISLTVNGPAKTLEIDNPGQIGVATFVGSIGQQLTLTLSNIAPSCPPINNDRITLRDRSGTQVGTQDWNACVAGDISLPQLPSTGLYQLWVDLHDARTADLDLALRSTGTLTPTTGLSPTRTNTATATLTPTPSSSPTPGGSATATYTATRVGTATPLAGAALVVRPNVISADRTLSADWALVPTPATTDWIGLFPENTTNDANPLAQVSTGGRESGQVSLQVPPLPTVTAGSRYELHLVYNAGGARLVSNGFCVVVCPTSTPTSGPSPTATSTPAGPSPTATRTATSGPSPTTTPTATATASVRVEVRPNRVPAGNSVSVSWTGIPTPTAADWLGLYVPASADSANLITPVLTTGQASGQVALTIPSNTAPGDYEVRLFNGSGTSSRLAISNLFTVTTPGTGLVPPAPDAAGDSVPLRPEPLLGAPPYRLLMVSAGLQMPAPPPVQPGVTGDADEDPFWTPRTGVPGLLSVALPLTPWRDLPALVAIEGETALTGQVLLLSGDPLADVTLRVGDVATHTDATGRFLLAGLAPGHQELVIDGRGANTNNRAYGVFVVGVDVMDSETTVLPYTVWMPRLDTANYVTISSPATEDIVLTTPRIPGLEVHIPAGSVIRDLEGNVVTELGITALPQDRPPFPLPEGKRLPVYFTVQPGGATIEPFGARVIYPNVMAVAPGTRVDFGHYDPARDGWYVYGRGTVAADGRQVVPDPATTLWSFTGSSIPLPCDANCPPPPPEPSPCMSLGCEGVNDPVDISTGLHTVTATDLTLPDLIPLRLARTGRPGDSVVRAFGKGATHEYELYLQQTGDANCSPVCLVLPDGGRVHYVQTNPGPGVDIFHSVYEHTETPSRWYKSQISWNSTESRWHLRLRNGTIYIFGSDAPLQGIRDRNGNQFTIVRAQQTGFAPAGYGDITRIVTPSGRWVAFEYDASHRVTEARDNLGRVVQYTYCNSGDSDGCTYLGYLKTVTDPDGLTRKYTYESDGSGGYRLKTIIDAKGHTVLTNTYTNGKVTSQALAVSGVTQSIDYTTYAPDILVTEAGGSQRRMTLNSKGYTTQETFGYGTSEAQTYNYTRDSSNRVTQVLDAMSPRRQTDYTYDSLGNLATVTRHTSTTTSPNTGTLVTSYVYDPTFSQPVSVTDPRGHTTRYLYDNRGNVTSIIDALGQETRLTYDLLGQPVSISDPLGNTWTLAYAQGNLASVTDPQGRTSRRFVDGAGRLVGVTDARGFQTKRTYDVLSRMTGVLDALNNLTQFGYDANSNLTSVTDPVHTSNPTTYGYDDMNRVTSRTDPLGNTASYEYDTGSNLTKVTDRRGKVTLYGYDSLHRRTCAAFGVTAGTNPCTPTTYESKTAYTWDAGNRFTQIADSLAGTNLTRAYDDLNRLTSEASAQGTITYTYHPNGGPRATMSVPSQSSVSYGYDGGERLSQISQGSSSVGYTYDSLNRRATLTLPNGVSLAYGYDTAGQLTGLTYSLGGSSIGQLSYDYDNAGQRRAMSGSYARTDLPAATTSAPTYNAANQMTAWNGTTLSYDLNGNLINDGTHTYQWDARNQLSTINSGSTATFTYDALSRRTSKTLSSVTTSFLYDGLNPVQEQVSGSASANLLTGLGIDEYFTRTETSTSTTRTLIGDALGSTLALLDNSGTVQTSYTYEAFGKATTSGTANSNPFKYTGREDDATGLNYYRGRYYSPLLQRFISEDPIGLDGGSVNPYAYVRNSPLNFRDPLGQAGGCPEGPPLCPDTIPTAPPEPSPRPSATPTAPPPPSPTAMPSPSPTTTPSPIPSPSPTGTPTPTPTPPITPTPSTRPTPTPPVYGTPMPDCIQYPLVCVPVQRHPAEDPEAECTALARGNQLRTDMGRPTLDTSDANPRCRPSQYDR